MQGVLLFYLGMMLIDLLPPTIQKNIFYSFCILRIKLGRRFRNIPTSRGWHFAQHQTVPSGTEVSAIVGLQSHLHIAVSVIILI